MKTHETIRLTLAATLLAGLLSSLIIFLVIGLPQAFPEGQAHQRHFRLLFFGLPFILSLAAAYFQYRVVLKPWHKALGELVAKSLNLNKNEGESSRVSGGDELGLLKQSIEVAAEQFKDARLREKSLVQHAVDVICVIDLKCKILSVNPASYSVWGYKPDELIGKQITDFLVSDDVKNTMKAIVGAEKSIDKIFFENRFRKKNGEIVDLLWATHLSASDRGLFCIAHDITDRKRAERLLKESEERIRAILEGLPAGVCVLEPDGRFEFMNNAARELIGISGEAELKHASASEIFSFFKDSSVEEKSKDTSGDVFDCQITKLSGERFPVEASMRNFKWGKGTAFLLIFLDATMKHEVERAKREFVAMVSHDLRTPLTAIALIFAYLLDGLGGELSEDGVDFARRGQDSCERLMTLVQDLLDLEKMRAGKFVMDKVETSLADVVGSAVDAVEPYAESHGIKLAVDCANIKCHCDGGRIIQVLINLISNAIKFSVPEGTVKVAVTENASDVSLSVSNFGKVIPQDKLASIFEKFEQANVRGAEERKGTGLGLAISKTIVEQHGGKISVESSEKDGTKFTFTIPKGAPLN